MSYEVYTYADPYRIDETDYWEDIKECPHLCSSRTLVRGLQDVIKTDNIQSLYCPIDEIVRDRVFPAWANDIELKLNQYSEIGHQLENINKEWHEQGKLTDKNFEALNHNKNELLDAVRLFIELDIHASSLNTEELNIEQSVFVELLRRLEGNRLFAFPEMPSVDEVKIHLIAQADSEIEEKKKLHGGKSKDTDLPESELTVLKNMRDGIENWDKKTLVIHGIHQFTALQLRFIFELEQQGVDIIFLHNYLKDYKKLYQTWDRIYEKFGVTPRYDKNIQNYESPNPIITSGEAAACNFASLFEEGKSADDEFCKNYSRYKDKPVLVYDNISEFADSISDEFRKAEKTAKLRNVNYGGDKGSLEGKEDSENISKAQALAQMNVAVYTANKDVDELLQIYYPDYVQSRHFLSYPIGQFFVALYDLWDEKTGHIRLDYDLLKKCIYSGYLSDCDEEHARQLLKTLIYSEPLFSYFAEEPKSTEKDEQAEENDKFSQFQNNYNLVHRGQKYDDLAELMYIYGVDFEQFQVLKDAITELDNTARWLFEPDEEGEQISFHTHFEKMKEYIEKKQMFLAYEEERDLVSKLTEHLNKTLKSSDSEDPEDTKVGVGTLEDLQNGIYYYLKQDEDTSVDWFVKNFEQIEGDILLSKKQQRKEQNKVYHFACVSDRDMNSTVDSLLPWPLSDRFVQKICNENKRLQIYYTALNERNNFMRYALFYGLYFCPCETAISFVKNYGEDDVTDCYSLLRLIGLYHDDNEMTEGDSDRSCKQDNLLSYAEKIIPDSDFEDNDEQIAAMYFCPYRYFLDYVLKSGPVISDDFQLKQLFTNVLITNIEKKLEESMKKGPSSKAEFEMLINDITGDEEGKKTRNKKVNSWVSDEMKNAEKIFFFLSVSCRLDKQLQARNYIRDYGLKSLLDQGRYISCKKAKEKRNDHRWVDFRKVFGKAKFVYENNQILPPGNECKAFNNVRKDNLSYSAFDIDSLDSGLRKEEEMKYIDYSTANLERPGKWCTYCVDRNICLASYGTAEEDE